MVLQMRRGFHKIFCDLWKLERAVKAEAITDIKSELAKFSWFRRLWQKRIRKHWIGIAVGLGIAVMGAWLSHWADKQNVIPSYFFETFSWLVHAFGTIPVLKHGEALWTLLFEV